MKANKVLNIRLKNNHNVNKICNDSKKVEAGDIFIAMSGLKTDGNNYIDEAIELGAKTIVSDKMFNFKEKYKDINFIVVDNIRKKLAEYCKRFYNDISADIFIIGITGTNGKTTTTTLLYKYFQYVGVKASLIGSNGIYIKDNFYYSNITTPDILSIYKCIAESKSRDSKYIIMEVSSHAIKQLRVLGIKFDIVLFTNLTQDHLDYHKTMEDYKYTKGILINSLSEKSICILNRDIDEYIFYDNLSRARTYTYGVSESDYQILNPNYSINGTEFDIKIKNNIYHINTKMVGVFNVYNIVSFISICDVMNLFNKKTIEFLNSNIQILGRMEIIKAMSRTFIIDFAHTPDGVMKILDFLSSVKVNKLIVVAGCGGSRDKSKRKIIGNIVSTLSDYAIFTSDNPRDEDEQAIIEDIIEGCKNNNYETITNRRLAIERAINVSEENDIVAILGKGNEQFQIKGNLKIPYNDKRVIEEIVF